MVLRSIQKTTEKLTLTHEKKDFFRGWIIYVEQLTQKGLMATQDKKDTTEKKPKAYKSEKKEMLLEELTRTMGIVSPACDKVGISRDRYYVWLKQDAEFKAKVDEIMERQIDFVETAFMRNIKEGNVQAQTFYLRTKGKNRGYAERTEITGADGRDLIPTRMTDEEIKKEIERLGGIGVEK